MMDASYAIYSLVVAWFTYHAFWMAMRIYQFRTFPRTYGQQPCLSLDDLGEAAYEQQRDIPAFKVIVPAYLETDVIEGTLYRLTSMNYPRTCYEVHVITYENEPVAKNGESTTQVVRKVAAAINAEAGIKLIHSIVTPRDYDGFFPGDLSAKEQHIGKARGLNYALRRIHEDNERDERSYFIGKVSRTGGLWRVRNILSNFLSVIETEDKLTPFIDCYFNPGQQDYIGALPCTSQLESLVAATELAAESGNLDENSWSRLVGFINQEASRFFLQLRQTEQAHCGYPKLLFSVLQDKEFLYSVMRSVELRDIAELESYSIQREIELEQSRPVLFTAISQINNCEKIFQLTRKFNSRWALVYDADADAPLDIMRHLAGRIITEPDVMGFQGPIAPLLNYDSVHPLCRMGALWMAFGHASVYPRLLHKKSWAHPLAGTNWCFRIEGFEYQNKLIRDCPYDEARRQFLLTFDPRQLTEDLETGVRNFSKWSVNAAWHPIVEIEQVPPTPGAMFRQHTRWSLGTIQTMGYILSSRLPLTQKVWYAMTPLRVLFASSGPFITGGLIIAFYLDALQVEPIFGWWTLFLAFGNFIYIWAFIETFERYYDMHQQTSAVNFLYKNRAELIELLKADSVCFTQSYANVLKETLQLIEKGMKPGGFVSNYFQSRYVDSENSEYSSAAIKTYVDGLRKVTPDAVLSGHFSDFVESFGKNLACVPIIEAVSGDRISPLMAKMIVLVDKATHKAGASKKLRWSKYHTQISLWAIPFVFYSVTPFFNAFWLWIKGETPPWDKTDRTVKNKMHTTKIKPSGFNYDEDK